MPYKITIEETKEVIATTGKEWAVIGDEEVEREQSFMDSDESKTRIKPIYGYTPEVEKKVTVKREVFMQTVDEMDLRSVIEAVNEMS